MNESSLTQLKIIVERAVRPVRASFGRKRAMREELLGHVSGVFEEEFAKVGDEQLALERAAQRFGQAAELTEQLQGAVPASDVIDRFFAGQPGESTGRAATRLGAWNLGLGVLVFVAATVLSGFLTVLPKEAILFTVFSILCLPTIMFLLTFATEVIRQAWYEPARRSSLRAALLTVGWFTITMALFEGLTRLNGVGPLFLEPRNGIWLTLWLAVSVPWLPWCLARVADIRIRYHREWASLQVD